MVYENVKKMCDKKGITIAQLERESGLPNGTIGKWRKFNPTAKSLQAVAKVLKTKMETLLQE